MFYKFVFFKNTLKNIQMFDEFAKSWVFKSFELVELLLSLSFSTMIYNTQKQMNKNQ